MASQTLLNPNSEKSSTYNYLPSERISKVEIQPWPLKASKWLPTSILQFPAKSAKLTKLYQETQVLSTKAQIKPGCLKSNTALSPQTFSTLPNTKSLPSKAIDCFFVLFISYFIFRKVYWYFWLNGISVIEIFWIFSKDSLFFICYELNRYKTITVKRTVNIYCSWKWSQTIS